MEGINVPEPIVNKKIEDVVICECHSSEHIILFRYDTDPDWDRVYMDIHLSKGSFWNRLKYGIKYIFGYKCRYGAFDEIIIKPDDTSKFERVYHKLCQIKIREKNREMGKNKRHLPKVNPNQISKLNEGV